MAAVPDERDALRAEIEEIVEIATGRVVTAEDLRRAGGDLQAAGVNSIGLINILDALDHRYAVVVRPEEDIIFLESIDSIVIRVAMERCGEETAAQ